MQQGAVDVGKNHLEENQTQDQDDGRNIDTAQIGHAAADRAQRRLGDPVEEIGHRIDEAVGGVKHVERDQPAQYGADDNDPDIKIDRNESDAKQGINDDHAKRPS